MLKQRLSISQRQRLSPMQIQVIRMLGYSTVEMEEIINKELEANPALEESDGDTVSDVRAPIPTIASSATTMALQWLTTST